MDEDFYYVVSHGENDYGIHKNLDDAKNCAINEKSYIERSNVINSENPLIVYKVPFGHFMISPREEVFKLVG